MQHQANNSPLLGHTAFSHQQHASLSGQHSNTGSSRQREGAASEQRSFRPGDHSGRVAEHLYSEHNATAGVARQGSRRDAAHPGGHTSLDMDFSGSQRAHQVCTELVELYKRPWRCFSNKHKSQHSSSLPCSWHNYVRVPLIRLCHCSTQGHHGVLHQDRTPREPTSAGLFLSPWVGHGCASARPRQFETWTAACKSFDGRRACVHSV